LTSVTANDVDTNPPLLYSFSDDSDEESLKVFSIDRYSGKVLLNQMLDFETQREYELKILASDTAHIAGTTLTVRVIDVNDNAPIFDSPAYYAVLPGKLKGIKIINLHLLTTILPCRRHQEQQHRNSSCERDRH
jgi:protocadherin-16/23